MFMIMVFLERAPLAPDGLVRLTVVVQREAWLSAAKPDPASLESRVIGPPIHAGLLRRALLQNTIWIVRPVKR